MIDDELSMEELEQVGSPMFEKLNEFITLYEQGDMQKVVELGQQLITNPAFSQSQKEEIAKTVDQAKQVLNTKEDTKGFGL